MKQSQGTILVTGSSGYLGYPVAARLSASFDVVGFDRRAPSHPPPTAECLYVDLTSEASLRRGLEAVWDLRGDRLASVIHFAAYYDFSGAPSPMYEKVTVRGTERLLRALRELFSVEQFIFSSTVLVHAPTIPRRPIDEDWPLEPRWSYPQSKIETEKVIAAERGDIPVVILRIAGVYDDLGHSVPLPRQIQRIYERDLTAHLFPGKTSHGQPFVHLDDVVDLVSLLVARRRQFPPALTLLAGEPETLSYGELQRMLVHLIHGEEWETRVVPKWAARIGAWLLETLPLGKKPFIKPWMIDLADDHLELDITRARTLAGWEPQRRLRDTLPKIVAALKADPFAWYRENELEMPAWLREMAPMPPAEQEVALEPHEIMRLRELARHDGMPPGHGQGGR